MQRWSEEWSGPVARVLIASGGCARAELRAAALRVLAALALHVQLLTQLATGKGLTSDRHGGIRLLYCTDYLRNGLYYSELPTS